jgi:hypothetical protein
LTFLFPEEAPVIGKGSERMGLRLCTMLVCFLFGTGRERRGTTVLASTVRSGPTVEDGGIASLRRAWAFLEKKSYVSSLSF